MLEFNPTNKYNAVPLNRKSDLLNQTKLSTYYASNDSKN